ncbi:glycosyltransferase family 2 protein [Jannaschia sp. W003]|uniref:glycosyltransferase family 2 protein n=1 Tax=Jannaschia sp. W003 TaxID=2867012 RepID=UPI0021A8673E|nr:glycosyltransferase family 2 protein [Jannaschia sp. W003]UWQ21854.1 glycosyltransferase family 2 protein [Jannaschia sp. W003]
MSAPPALGVVVVCHDAEAVVGPCLGSLMASQGAALDVVVVDNASRDATAAAVCAVRAPAPHRLRLVKAGRNGGFAAGVNLGLGALEHAPRVWLLNPDCTVPPGTAQRLAAHPEGFGLLGGRVLYEGSGRIQTDGGTLDRRTGRTRNVHQGAPADAPAPDPAAMDFVTGASLVASRAFLRRAGPMPEDYFLYYEEVAWARRRGDLALAHDPEAVVLHAAGHSIGSGRPDREPSPLSLWFLHRSRQRFAARHFGARVVPRLWTLAKAAQALSWGRWTSAGVLARVALGLPAPGSVRARVPPEALR